ncbi:transposase [Kosakonia pseudosacchari]|uniref:transposase n=1 Tax=Kosakonia pseudosacchari TaxID=1646340 RepID=UPI003A5BDFB8
MIAILKSIEAGRAVKYDFLELGISEASYDNWKPKYGELEAVDIKKTKDVEDEKL